MNRPHLLLSTALIQSVALSGCPTDTRGGDDDDATTDDDDATADDDDATADDDDATADDDDATADDDDATADDDATPPECLPGFEWDGFECTDIDECTLQTDNCDPLVVCTDTDGSFECGACPAEYVDTNGDGTLCTDIDECAEGTDDCDTAAECTNIDGSFECECNPPWEDLLPSDPGTSCGLLATVAGGGDLLAIDGNLRFVDPLLGTTLATVPMDLTGETIFGAPGMAMDPTTGDLFVVVKTSGTDASRDLVTVDPSTGAATFVGDLGDAFANVAFDSTGLLYGVTGNANRTIGPEETLYTLDTTTAATTLVGALGNGGFGEGLGFGPGDVLYHISGNPPIFESVDLPSLTTTDIAISSPATSSEANGLLWWESAGVFLMARGYSSDALVTLDVAGASVLVGATDHHIKGMAWVDVYAPAGVLVINEIFQNPLLSGDTPGEWFEIKNVSGIDLDLAGWTISDADFDAHVMDPANGTTVIPAGGLLVLGQSTDTVANGGAAVDYAYGTADFFLANGADEVQLLSPDGVMVDDIEYDDGATFPDPNGFSMELDPGSQDAASNDDGTNWCETSAASYGVGGSGSPGVENGGCP